MDYSWIQISDLHLFNNSETVLLSSAFRKIAEKYPISFIIVTGDLHQYLDNYEKTIDFLDTIRISFKLEKTDIYIVPGNHDSGDCKFKEPITYYIEKKVENEQDCYVKYFEAPGLIDCFKEYSSFINDYYGSNNPYDKPEQICIRSWKNQLNIIHLNTAINCNGDNSLQQIVDIHKLVKLSKDEILSRPSIIIAHHPFSSLHKSHRDTLTRLITDWKVSAYLCGDHHKLYDTRIRTLEYEGSSIPCIVCAKATPETNDTFSDLGCIVYTKQNDTVTVHPYKWNTEKKSFVETSDFSTDKGLLDFPLLTNSIQDIETQLSDSKEHNHGNIMVDPDFAKYMNDQMDIYEQKNIAIQTPQLLSMALKYPENIAPDILDSFKSGYAKRLLEFLAAMDSHYKEIGRTYQESQRKAFKNLLNTGIKAEKEHLSSKWIHSISACIFCYFILAYSNGDTAKMIEKNLGYEFQAVMDCMKNEKIPSIPVSAAGLIIDG